MEKQFDWVITNSILHPPESIGLVVSEVCNIYAAILAVFSADGCAYRIYGNLYWLVGNAFIACGCTNGLYGGVRT